MVLYNSAGRPVAYCENGEDVYLYDGRPVAYLHQGSLYSFSGAHLGRYENGWIRDNGGYCVFFTDGSVGGPVKPVRHVRPIKSVRAVRPVKGVRAVRPMRPIDMLGWSALSSEEFFR